MEVGTKVRLAFYSIAKGGVVYGDEIGVIIKAFAAVVFVDFNGKIRKINTCNLAIL